MIALVDKPQTLLVERGRVMCPIRGDLDVERCFGCRWLRLTKLEDGQPEITCQAMRPPILGLLFR